MASALLGRRLERWNIGAPVVMVVAGAVVGVTVEGAARVLLDTVIVERVAELILAVLLFVDAIEIRGGRLWGRSPGLAARMLLVAMPLSILAALGTAEFLFPELAFPVLLVLACVVMPIDFAPNEKVLRDRRLPTRLRTMLNVEGGYNDGLVAPVFVFALALAGGNTPGSQNNGPTDALSTALPHAVIAIVIGLLLGTLLGGALEFATAHGLTTDRSRRIVVLLAPVAAYAASLATNGNGFVAAFVCGIAFRYVHRVQIAHRLRSGTNDKAETPDNESRATGGAAVSAMTREFTLVEDVAAVLAAAMWFVVGIATVTLALIINLPILIFCALALTVLRIIPVLLALLGTDLTCRERLLAGLLGPRGTATIVLGLLAFNGLPDQGPADTILMITMTCVIGSVLLHGPGTSTAVTHLNLSRVK
ncbi:cation:proton antiporter [Pseudonocardia sp. EC080625-04]|uniref:cation:proton antiporter domain-containing protein n=1 Tax=Pseudonocardia sp. EC080625-04 TaxID=1096868 RepID=UPI001EE75CEE|nr:cation:proton antiporter [Pseudonocardia sp. EC080625-04]